MRPGVPAGTTIAEISFLPSGRSPVTAVTITREVMAVPEFVMNAFEPSITHSPPSRRAVVRVAPGSDPPPGPVSPNAPSASPRQSGGSHRRFCSCVPNRKIGIAPRPTPASRVIATDESTRPSSSIARQSVVRSAPCPSHSSGNGMPNSPSSPIRRTMSSGNSPVRSNSTARGRTTSSANSRTVRRKDSCSSVRSKSTARSISGRAPPLRLGGARTR